MPVKKRSPMETDKTMRQEYYMDFCFVNDCFGLHTKFFYCIVLHVVVATGGYHREKQEFFKNYRRPKAHRRHNGKEFGDC